MRPLGYITTDKGRRVLALVAVTELGRAGRRSAPAPCTETEQAALESLLVHPAANLEISSPVNPIRAARVAAGITQADLAFALGISQPMLSRQEQAFRRVRPGTVERALTAIKRIRENRNRPVVPLEAVLTRYGSRLAESSARNPRDPVERRLLREAGDRLARGESDAQIREGGERRRPPTRTTK